MASLIRSSSLFHCLCLYLRFSISGQRPLLHAFDPHGCWPQSVFPGALCWCRPARLAVSSEPEGRVIVAEHLSAIVINHWQFAVTAFVVSILQMRK